MTKKSQYIEEITGQNMTPDGYMLSTVFKIYASLFHLRIDIINFFLYLHRFLKGCGHPAVMFNFIEG